MESFLKIDIKQKAQKLVHCGKTFSKTFPFTDNFVLNMNFIYATTAGMRKKLSIILEQTIFFHVSWKLCFPFQFAAK